MEPQKAQKIPPLAWQFVMDDGRWIAFGTFTGGHQITTSTVPNTPTVFLVQRRVDDRDIFETFGVCRTLENAKMVCELLENG